VILDPPAFIKSRKHLAEGQKGYLTVNRGALEMVAPGGVLVTCLVPTTSIALPS